MPAFYDVSVRTLESVMGKRKLRRRGIVYHETDGFDSLAYLQGGSLADGRRVSSDYLISRSGNIYQITLPGWYAFHSGRAVWRDYSDPDHSLNQSFVGIELENKPDHGQVVTDPQYIALAWLTRRLLGAFPISFADIAGHGQVALPLGRKSDPITLDWTILTRELILPSKESNDYILKGELS